MFTNDDSVSAVMFDVKKLFSLIPTQSSLTTNVSEHESGVEGRLAREQEDVASTLVDDDSVTNTRNYN